MKNQQQWLPLRSRVSTYDIRGFFSITRALLLVAALIVSNIFVTIKPAFAAAVSAEQYCKTYTNTDAKNACKAGVNGQEDCNDYSLAFDQSIGDICYKAVRDREAGLVKAGTVTVTPSPSPTPSKSPVSTPSQSESQGDSKDKKSLSDYIDSLHDSGKDSDKDTEKQPDDTYGQYINGAGKKQEIRVLKQGTGGSPAILFFNGGGWLQNDCSGQKVAAGGGTDCSHLGGGEAEKAGDRGYALFDVTYRLGTSSVYYAFEDTMRGIKHMRDNAAMYGIDPNKIVIWGDSAGGSLVMRAAGSGKSGAKAAVGWSAPTNAYTALFKSFQSFAIGVSHSTCVPTDLAGFANFADLATGGSGDVAEYGMGISSNDFSALGIDLGTGSFTGVSDPLTLLSQGLIAGKNLLSLAGDAEKISKQIKSGGGMSGSTFNLASKKFVECLDNFNVLSPALFASPDTPPSFLAEFEDDGVVDPSQAYGMRDKLIQLGIRSEALVLPGSEDCRKPEKALAPAGAGGCHLGYYKDFVCPSLNFVDSIVQPERGKTDCGTGIAENQASNDAAAPPSSSSSSQGGGGNQQTASNTKPSQAAATPSAEQKCTSGGGSWADRDGDGKSSCSYPPAKNVCDTWDSSCNGGTSASGEKVCYQGGYMDANGVYVNQQRCYIKGTTGGSFAS